MHSIEKIEKGFRLAAVPVVLISAAFTYAFAASTMQSPAMGAALGLACAICAVASGYVWTIRQAARNYGAGQGTLTVLLLAGLMFTSTDAFTNAGSLLWQRQASDNASTVQNVKYAQAQDSVAKAEDRIAFFKKRIADLEGSNPWVSTMSAPGLDGEIAAKQEELAQEEKRGGCGPRCLQDKEELAALLDKKAKVQEFNKASEMLAASHKGLAKAKAEAKGETSVVSATSSQAASIATLISLDLNPSEDSQAWTGYVVGLVLAFFLTFGGMALNWIGYGVWRQSSFGHYAQAKADVEAGISRAVTKIRDAKDSALNRNALFEDMLARLEAA